ncbi:MAG: ABC transporter ATP-binding protein [Ruminococcaceae bacterium]|jgi:simple sugar transport system ATP-binding protein|nr:ABC transporter ATP-binding protein [Oscillospiraceae bacterium]
MPDILNMVNMTKYFGTFKANDNICIDVRQGEILALLGENGAGKTTLMNLLYGLYQPSSGKIIYQGEEVVIDSPLTAISMGIGMVHQHFMLVKAFKTWENVVLGLQDEQKHLLREKVAKEKIARLAEEYRLQIDPDAQIDSLSVGLQQQVEIAKVLYRGCRLLIMDEPTGVLTPVEKEKLFVTLRELTKGGLSVIFISHKLDEVLEISDRVAVLCRGKNVCTVNTKDVTKEDLARMMVGRDVVLTVERGSSHIGEEEILTMRGVCVTGNRLASCIRDMDLCIHRGEIFGIAGVDGNGQSELVEAINGMRRVDSGTISVCGQDITNASPHDIIRSGTAWVPEDRKAMGTVHSFSIDRNLILRNIEQSPYVKRGNVDYEKLHSDTEGIIEEFDIRFAGRGDPVSHMSGGNLQKVILAREIRSQPKLLVAMHPTRGLDVGAIEFIHRKILDAANAGAAVLLVSTELEEIISLSDTVCVISGGQLSQPLRGDTLTMENLGLLMGGSQLKGGAEHAE